MGQHRWTLQEKMEVGKIIKGTQTEAEVAVKLGHTERMVRGMVSRMEEHKKSKR